MGRHPSLGHVGRGDRGGVENERLAKAYDRDWFKSVLGIVDLHPEQAVDAP